MNNILIDHLKKWEGCKLTAYKCPAGIWTIGYGCTGSEIKEGAQWTANRAHEELCFRANKCLKNAFSASPILKFSSMSRQAAIGSFIYNCGFDAYEKSTLRQCVDKGDWSGAAFQIRRWNKAKGKVLQGLVNRRLEESTFLLRG